MRRGFLGLFFLLSTALAGYAEAAESRETVVAANGHGKREIPLVP